MNDIITKRETILNISYSLIGKLIASVVQFGSNIILSRFLEASDFGIVNISNIVNNMLGQFNEFGINTALIQKEELNDSAISTAVILKAIISLSLTLMTYVLAPLVARYFNNAAITDVIRVTSINFILSIFFFVPNVLLVKSLYFKTLAKINTYSTIITSLITILLAFYGWGYWSLVYSVIINSIINIILFNICNLKKFRLVFDRDAANHIIKFGGSILLTKVVVQILFSSDNFIIGHLEGIERLGYYSVAFSWGAIFCGLVYPVVSGVIFPTFSKVQNDLKLLRQGYLKVFKFNALLGVVIYVTMFVVSRDFVIGILGAGTNKWAESITCLRIFCLYGTIRIILEPIGSLCLAMGQPSTLFKANLLAIIVQLTLLYPVLKLFSLEGVAVLVTFSYLSQYLVYSKYILPQLKITTKEMVNIIMPIVALLPFASLVFMDGYLEYSFLIMVCKAIFTVTSCILMHGIFTKWELMNEIYATFHRQ